MSFLDQFGDGISIAVGFIVIRVREHVHFDKNIFFCMVFFYIQDTRWLDQKITVSRI